MNKRAQAQIITTVLIILLVLAAVVIVWQVISATVREGTKGISETSNCVTTRLEIKSMEPTGCNQTDGSGNECTTSASCGTTCSGVWNTGHVVVQRTSGGSGEVGIKVLIDGDMQKDNEGTGELGPLESEKINFDSETGKNEPQDKVEIAVVLNPAGDEPVVCEVVDTWEV
jgi:hypothetical protein